MGSFMSDGYLVAAFVGGACAAFASMHLADRLVLLVGKYIERDNIPRHEEYGRRQYDKEPDEKRPDRRSSGKLERSVGCGR